MRVARLTRDMVGRDRILRGIRGYGFLLVHVQVLHVRHGLMFSIDDRDHAIVQIHAERVNDSSTMESIGQHQVHQIFNGFHRNRLQLQQVMTGLDVLLVLDYVELGPHARLRVFQFDFVAHWFLHFSRVAMTCSA